MEIKLTIKRLDLIKAIEASAKANQKAYDDALATALSNALIKAMDDAIAAAFKNVPTNYANPQGYIKSNCESYANTFLISVGLNKKTIPAPQLYERQLQKLKMAIDETLAVDDSSDYFSFLKP